LIDDPESVLDTIRPAQETRFGDYQMNGAMTLGKRLGKSPREIAQQIVSQLDVDDICQPPEIAGPGFINLKLKNEWLCQQLETARHDERLGIAATDRPLIYVVDYSSPNVAKPMHVGHIRSTVIGDALCRILRFVGHRVISDNHLGDWGTQFGMIIYGFRHFLDQKEYHERPVAELGRVYQIVRRIMDYHAAVAELPRLEQKAADLRRAVEEAKEAVKAGDKAAAAKAAKSLRRLEAQLSQATAETLSYREKIESADRDPRLSSLVKRHAGIESAVLNETARLHRGDPENLELWREFLPKCRVDIQRIYDRLGVSFDVELGESFYHDQLADVVHSFQQKGLARTSEGAICVFMDEFDSPMIIQKKDGAYLYSTTDLATIEYRMRTWNPDVILYVVDFRQSDHFEKLFAAARLWGYDSVELRHIEFGTVLGADGKPFRTRDGDTVGLEALLDTAVERAERVVSENDDQKPTGPELTLEQRKHVASVVGHAAIKYADLSQNRASDYVYSEEKMVSLRGNTATYMQYSYARVRNIFAKGGIDIESIRRSGWRIRLDHPSERALAVGLLRFSEAIDEVVAYYEPHHLTTYLYSLAGQFSEFYESCPVLKAENDEQRNSRLLLCDLVARTIKLGLSLLGIDVVEKM
jgi:arginyl-tRNA synthetase